MLETIADVVQSRDAVHDVEGVLDLDQLRKLITGSSANILRRIFKGEFCNALSLFGIKFELDFR